jgi:lycopene cyclase domain-containing protein
MDEQPDTKQPRMLRNVLAWIGLFVIIFTGIRIIDRFALKMPWYFIFLVVVLFFPNILFIRYALRRDPAKRLVVLAQAGISIVFMYIAEILAIQYLYWGFLQDWDRLVGLDLGNVPLEEFLFYPLMLNVSLYGYLQAKSILKKYRAPLPDPYPRSRKRLMGWGLAAAFVGVAVIIGLCGSGETVEGHMDRDEFENPVYVDGAQHKAWGITMMSGMAITIAAVMGATVNGFLDWKAVFFAGAIIYPASMVIELLGIGRGWWVYNDQQLIGLKLYILPLESLFMYLIGCVFPASIYEILRQLLRTTVRQEENRQ